MCFPAALLFFLLLPRADEVETGAGIVSLFPEAIELALGDVIVLTVKKKEEKT